ncbi:hypothetical protein EG329_005006 [Mollisiaceae sp. DMI_Dod_QoI]|nr:hypothetical protein EG329_005006 [Helotiales sp. DMI_Dod_QoI]
MPVVYSKLDASPLPFLHLLEVLKHLDRTGWKRWLDRPESVAAHMYRLEFLVMFAPMGVDKERCRWIAFCHDIAESFAGDIPTYAPVSKAEKYKLEDFGIRYIESLLQLVDPKLGANIRAAWEEYENGNTPEATPEGRWVREMDKFECMIQAHEYEQSTYGEQNLEEFQGQTKYIHSQEGKDMLELLQQERQAHFQKRSQRTPVIFVKGTSGVDTKTQCDLLCKGFDFQHISLRDVLREKAADQTYLHAKFVRDCLEEDVNVPTQLAISLLELKINEGRKEGKSWSLVEGFPESMEQILEFKKKVQKLNYVLFLSCSSAETPRHSLGGGSDDSDVVNHLKAVEGYFKEICGDGSVEEVYALAKKAVEDFIQQAETEK